MGLRYSKLYILSFLSNVHCLAVQKKATVVLSTLLLHLQCIDNINWAPSSEFVSSSIPSWQILTVHAQTFRGARDLAFCLKVSLDSLLVWASSEGSGETARMRRLAWTFAARICDKYQIRLTRSNWASSWDYDTYRIGDQRRLRWACASAQSHQSLRCSHTWTMEVDEGSDQKSDI